MSGPVVSVRDLSIVYATRRGPVDDEFMRENVNPLLREN